MSKERDVRCELCNVSTPTIVDQINHDASLIHHMKLDHYHKGNWTHVCGICTASTGTLKSFINHLKGRKHEMNYAKEKPKWSSRSSYKIPSSFFLKPKANDVNLESTELKISSSHMKPHLKTLSSNAPEATRNNFHNIPDIGTVEKSIDFRIEKSNNRSLNQPWVCAQSNVPPPWNYQASSHVEWNVQNFQESNPQNQFSYSNNWSQPQYNNYQNNWNTQHQWYPSAMNNNWGINPIMQPDYGAQGYSKFNEPHAQNFIKPPGQTDKLYNDKNLSGPPQKFNSTPQNPSKNDCSGLNNPRKFNVWNQNKSKGAPLQQKTIMSNNREVPISNQPNPSQMENQEKTKESTSKVTRGSRSSSKSSEPFKSTSQETRGYRSISKETKGSKSTSQETGGPRRAVKETDEYMSLSKETIGSTSKDRSTSKETRRPTSKETKRSTSKETKRSTLKETRECTKRSRSRDSTSSQKSSKSYSSREKFEYSKKPRDREKPRDNSPVEEEILENTLKISSKFKTKYYTKDVSSKLQRDTTRDLNKSNKYKTSPKSPEEKINNGTKKDKQKDNAKKKVPLQEGENSNIKQKASKELMEDRITSSKSSTDSTGHLYFLSSDSDGEGDMKNKSDEIISNLNKNNEGNKSFNKILINRLVNHPCTPRQQLQLTRWLQSQEKSRKVSMPRFNLPLNESENAIENVMNELPDDILTSLYRAIENDDLTQPEMEVCLKTEATDDNSGNIPWADFLKSLEENGNILDPIIQHEDQINEDSISEEPVTIKKEPYIDTELVAGLRQQKDKKQADNIPKDTSTIQVKNEPIDATLTTTIEDIREPLNNSNSQQSDRGTPSSLRRPPSVGSCNTSDPISFDQSQKEVNEWINRLNTEVPECITIPTTPPRPGSESGSTVLVPSKDLVDELLRLNNQEELLRDQSQKVEQVISQLYRLLEEWKMKRSEIILQETNFRNKRMKLLENLKGAFQNGNPSQVKIIPDDCSANPPSTTDANNAPYMDTLESTLNFVNELGNDLGFNISQVSSTNIAEEELEPPLPDSSNWESSPSVAKKITKMKKTRKKKDSNIESVVSTNKNKKKNTGEIELPKKKRKRKSETEISSTSTIVEKKKKLTNKISEPSQEEIEQACMMRDYMSTVMPQHLGTEISDPSLTSLSSETNQTPMIDDNESQNDATIEEEIFESLKIHKNAIIDLKAMKGFLYSCSSDKMAKRIDLKDRTKIMTYEGHEKSVSSIQVFEPRNLNITLVFTSCHDCFLRCFNAETGHCIDKTDLSSPIVSMTLCWERLFLGLQNGKIVPYDIANSKLMEPILGSNDISISYICAASEGCQRLLFIVDYKGTVAVRNANTGLFIRSLEGTVKPPCRITVHSLSVYITTMDKTILIYDLMTGALVRKITSGSSSATGISFIGDKAICCYLDGSIKCYDKTSWKLLCIFYNPEKPMTMCMEIKNNWIYTGNRFGSIQGFKLDFSSMKVCKYQKCPFPPFGREDDLRRHMQDAHMNRAELNNLKICPWRGCSVNLSHISTQTKKSHILCHASKECY